jgi:hypothetical protein
MEVNMRLVTRIVRSMLGGGALALLCGAGPARAEREHTDPTGWWWMYGASEADINARADLGFRLFDIEVEQTSPYRFTGSFVRNEGVHAKGWWWLYGQTETQLEQFLAANNARILDLEVVRVSGQPRLTATMISNTGDDATAWWYYYDTSLTLLAARVMEHGARIIDLDTYVVNGVRYWSAVMIRNTGQHYSDWWAYSNLTAPQLFTRLVQHNARILDLERRSSTTYAVVLVPWEGKFSRYNFSLDEGELIEFYRQIGCRIVDIESRVVDGTRVFDAVVLDNTNELEGQLRDLMLPRTDGAFGFYLKRVGGPVHAKINEMRSFYPASTIKVVEHLASMDALEQFGLSDVNVPRWSDHTNDIHVGPPYPAVEPLSVMQTLMMVPSNNQRTNNIQDMFGRIPQPNNTFLFSGVLGRSRINQHAWNTVGLTTATALRHKFGAGGPDTFDPANSATLRDLGHLYERVAQGTILNPPNRTTFYSRMLNYSGPNNSHSLFNVVTGVIQQQAASLGVSGSDQQTFLSNLEMAFKAGSLNVSRSYASTSGWISLPVRQRDGSLGAREYVFGAFVDAYTFANFGISSSNTPQVTGELLRPVINSALSTFP